MNEEIKDLLNAQKGQLKKVEEQKTLLIGSGKEESKYSSIKEAFGWDDTDLSLRQELNKTMELSVRIKENINSSILTEEALIDYCIRNNYALTNVRNYKGVIPEELLVAIDNYCKENNLALGSEYVIGNLYILCQFTDTRANNNNLKKSKRYNKSIPKIMLFEKLDKSNAYKEVHYKCICEIGEKKPLSNFIKSIYLTHVKSGNHARYLALWSSITFLALLITFIIVIISGNLDNYYYITGWRFSRWLVGIGLGIMILKSTVGTVKSDEWLSMSLDFNYNHICKDGLCRKWFLTSYMFGDGKEGFVKKVSFWRNQVAMWSMNISFFLIFSGLLHLQKMYFLNKTKQIVVIKEIVDSSICDEIPADTIKLIYKKTGILTYSENKIHTLKNNK